MKASIVRSLIVKLALMVFVLGLISGCGSSQQAYEINERLTSIEMVTKKPPDATYVVDPPDSISIEFLSDPSLSRSAVLRQDGTVTLPYLEDVKVAGMTTIQIREKLESLYSRYYREPRILVAVTSFASKKIFVYGEATRNGSVPYRGYTTVRDVIGDAGGISTRAAFRRVRLIRGDPYHPEVYKIDVYKLLFDGDTSNDVSVAENDVIYVPPTFWAWLGYRVEDLLFPFRTVLAPLPTYRAVREISEEGL